MTAEVRLLMLGYRLTTAEIIYRLPDYPSLLQEFIWQDLDVAPRFPKLKSFLDFWEKEIDGPLYKVRIAACEKLTPNDLKMFDLEIRDI